MINKNFGREQNYFQVSYLRFDCILPFSHMTDAKSKFISIYSDKADLAKMELTQEAYKGVP